MDPPLELLRRASKKNSLLPTSFDKALQEESKIIDTVHYGSAIFDALEPLWAPSSLKVNNKQNKYILTMKYNNNMEANVIQNVIIKSLQSKQYHGQNQPIKTVSRSESTNQNITTVKINQPKQHHGQNQPITKN